MNRVLLALAVGFFAVGCGSSDHEDDEPVPDNGIGPDGRIVKQCEGFPLEGLRYSPGGSVPPNKCAPFHPTTNNAYAVRCIDAMPHFKTRYAGDQYCILPPAEGKGIQVGIHPQEKDYWNQVWAGDLSGYEQPGPEWEIDPGVEITEDYRGSADNPEPGNYYRTYFRMRTGSHHQIVTTHAAVSEPDQWMGSGLGGIFGSQAQVYGAITGILGGEQRPDDNTPVSLDKPPEDQGLYLAWPAQPSIVYNLHYFNATHAPTLREVWVNIWWEDDARIPVNWYMGHNLTAGRSFSVPPGQTVNFHYFYSWGGDSDLRLLRVFGHRHFWTTNFSSWIERVDNPGSPELIYQSFDWADMPTYRYDSVTQNPKPGASRGSDGAASGLVILRPGDELHFNCHVEYTAERASQDSNAPIPSEPLRFGNQVYEREMCIEFGNVTGGGLGFPEVSTEPLPDFATSSGR
jgi:hypothetical protein